jgi:hypothetical protein
VIRSRRPSSATTEYLQEVARRFLPGFSTVLLRGLCSIEVLYALGIGSKNNNNKDILALL